MNCTLRKCIILFYLSIVLGSYPRVLDVYLLLNTLNEVDCLDFSSKLFHMFTPGTEANLILFVLALIFITILQLVKPALYV